MNTLFWLFLRIDENSSKESKQSIFLMEAIEEEIKMNEEKVNTETGSRSCSCSPARETLPDTSITQVERKPKLNNIK